MCFFVNNQHRILLEKCTTGSADLESIFECSLKRIGRVVAVLDTWNQPLYLGRVWTMYEQFVASTLQIPVCFVMPEDSAVSRWKVFNILCFPRFPTCEHTRTTDCHIDILFSELLFKKMHRVCNVKAMGVAIFHDWAWSCFALFVSAHDLTQLSNCFWHVF